MAASWSLTDAERADTVDRVASNIATLAFVKGRSINEEDARTAAVAVEKRAYATAQVAARTTTGERPTAETTSAYARKLGELVLDLIKTSDTSNARDTADAGVAAHNADEHDLSGTRDFLTRESAAEALAPLLAAGAAIRKVKLSTKSFGAEAALVAADALRNVAHALEHADLSDVLAGRPEDEALEALRILSASLTSARLKHLNLSDNALGEKGVRAAAEVLSGQPALEFLSLQNVGASIHACAAVAELVTRASDLRGLHLYNNMSDNQGAAHIASLLARAPLMADFKMASSRVGPAGGVALARALATGTSLVRLDLSDNPLTAEVAAPLALTLRAHPHLTHLNLNDTGLTDEGVTALCDALAGATPALEELELALNEVTADGARVLAGALAGKARLRRLNLRENELEDGGAVALAAALPGLASLQQLDVSANQLQRPGALALARAAARLPDFALLGCDENAVSEAGVEQLRALLGSKLGSMEENDPDMVDEEGEEEEEEEEEAAEAGDDAGDDLAAALGKTHL